VVAEASWNPDPTLDIRTVVPKEAGSEDCSEKGFTSYLESFFRVVRATESNSQLLRDADDEWNRHCPKGSPTMGQDKFKAAMAEFFLTVCPCEESGVLCSYMTNMFRRLHSIPGEKKPIRGCKGGVDRQAKMAQAIAVTVKGVHEALESAPGNVISRQQVAALLSASSGDDAAPGASCVGIGGINQTEYPPGDLPEVSLAMYMNSEFGRPLTSSNKGNVMEVLVYDEVARWVRAQINSLTEVDYSPELLMDPTETGGTGSLDYQKSFKLIESSFIVPAGLSDDFFTVLSKEATDTPYLNQVFARAATPGGPKMEPRRGNSLSAKELKDVFKRILHSSIVPSRAPSGSTGCIGSEMSCIEAMRREVRGRYAAQSTLPIAALHQTIPGRLSRPPEKFQLECFDADDEFIRYCEQPSASIMLLAPPGCGGSQLAQGIASKFGLRHLEPSSLIEQEIKRGSELGQKAAGSLAGGEEVERDVLMAILASAFASESVQCHGYIIEGFPLTDAEYANYVSWTGGPPDYVVELSLSEEEACVHRTSLRRGPSTGAVYSEADIHPDGPTNRLVDPSLEDPPPVVKTGEEEEEAEAAEEDDPDAPPRDDGPIKHADMGLLLLHPEDGRSKVLEQIAIYRQMRTSLAGVLAQYHPLRHIVIEGVQPPADILGCAQDSLRHLHMSHPAKGVTFAEGSEFADAEALAGALDAPEEGMPSMVPSLWKNLDPVSALGGLQLAGKAEHAVCFMGRCFLFTGEAQKAQFINNPKKYIGSRPNPGKKRVAVIGGPMTPSAAVAKELSALYGWDLVTMGGLVQAAYQKPYKKGEDRKLLDALHKGGGIAASTAMSLIPVPVKDKKTGEYTKNNNPCVIEGLPVEAELGAAAHALLLDYIIVLQDEAGEETASSNEAALSKGDFGYSDLTAAAGKFTADLEAFSTSLEEAGKPAEPAEGEEAGPNTAPPVVKVDGTGGLSAVLGRVRRSLDPFLYEASATDLGSLPWLEGDAASEQLDDGTLWGDAGRICPVSLSKKLLRHGLSDFVAKYRGRFYQFAGEEEMAAFMASPEAYTGKDLTDELPPPMLMVVGPPGAGVESLSRGLTGSCGIPTLDLNEVMNVFDHGTLAVDNQGLIDQVKSALAREPYLSHGCILCGLPYLEVDKVLNEEGEEEAGEPRDPAEQIAAFIEAGIMVDAVVNITMDEETAAKRRLIEPTEEELEASRLATVEDLAEEEARTEEEIDAAIEELRVAEMEARTAAITESNAAAIDAIEGSVVSLYTEKGVPIVTLGAGPREGKIESLVTASLYHILKDRSLLLARAYPKPPHHNDTIEADLSALRRSLSQFVRDCPVCIAEDRAIRSSEYSEPVLYRHHVYFPKGPEERAAFLQNPRNYAIQASDPLKVPPRCFVTGPLQSGKSSVAEKIARDTGAALVSMQDVLARIASGPSAMKEQLDACLLKGEPVSDELCVAALQRALGSMACNKTGWVVDGFPMTVQQACLLEEARIVPHGVFLTAAVDGVALKSGSDPASKPISFKEAITDAAKISTPALKKLESFYNNMHDNCVRLPVEASQWQRGAHGSAIVWRDAKRERDRRVAQRDLRASRCLGLGITPQEIQLAMGKFMSYCPVSFVENEALSKCGEGVEFAAEYRGQIHKTASLEHLERFLSDPSRYVDGGSLLAAPLGGRLPVPIPEKGGYAEHDALALQGHCPVTLWLDPKDRRCVLPGSTQLQVQYGDSIFRMANKVALQAFLEKPWLYCDQSLPTKMPAARESVALAKLPARGYCEQTLARSITSALHAMGEQRPKYPGMRVQDSVNTYLALYLRAHNKDLPPEKRDQALEQFDDFVDCCNMARFLADNKEEPLEADKDYREVQKKFEAVRKKKYSPVV